MPGLQLPAMMPAPSRGGSPPSKRRPTLRRIAAARHAGTLARCRLLWLLALCALVAARPAVDTALQDAWVAARGSDYFKSDSFEPLLATLAFGLWINMWRVLDLFGGPCLHKWKLHGPPRTEREFKGQSKIAYMLTPGISNFAAAAYLVPLFAIDYLYPRRKLPIAAPTAAELLGGMCMSLFLYDFLFYWVHVALHRSAFLYRHVHAVHHTQVTLSSHETIHHSFVDGTLQVLTNVCALRILRLHPFTRALHNITVTYLLTETHSGYDMPWMLHNVLPHGVMGGSPAHEAHHRGGEVCFQQFFTYLDWLLPSKAATAKAAVQGSNGEGCSQEVDSNGAPLHQRAERRTAQEIDRGG